MSGKDIALTTGGVVASMVLAWLLYRLQQRDQARAAAQATEQAAQDASSAVASDPYNNALTDAWLASSLAAQVQATGTTTNTPASEGTSAAVADLGAYYDSTDTQHLLSNIVAAFTSSPSSSLDLPEPPAMTTEQLDAITIPAISGVAQTATGNIPVTAQDAAAQARLALSPNVPTYYSPGGSGPGYYIPGGGPGWAAFPVSMQSGSDVSSHPVDPHPIVSSGVHYAHIAQIGAA